MTRQLLYNPENDLALAANLKRFTPPRAGSLMAQAGALLPLWWTLPGDSILARPSLSSEADAMKSQFGLHGSVGLDLNAAPSPWGWSLASRQKFLDVGFSKDSLPSPDNIALLRALSHRRTTIAIHRALKTSPSLIPVEARSLATALAAISRFNSDAVIKSPWSCSGRGVFFSRSCKDSVLTSRIEAIISRQRSVLIEPRFDDIRREVAALYFSSPEGIVLKGFSVFNSAPGGAYSGNMVAPQSRIESLCGPHIISAARQLTTILDNIIARRYVGWLGVDMLVTDSGINPCMELNLRMTMGVVALFIAKKGLEGTILCTNAPLPSDLRLSPKDSPVQFVVRPKSLPNNIMVTLR